MPGFGAQILWRPIEQISMNSNDYVGWDTQDNPGRFRFHTDNSFELMYYHVPMKGNFISKMAFTLTGDLGGETGDGVTPFGGHHDASNTGASCTIKNPCEQHFLSWMAYNRIWFDNELFGWDVGGGQMNNPGRYLVLPPTGVATPYQALSTDGVGYTSPVGAPRHQAFLEPRPGRPSTCGTSRRPSSTCRTSRSPTTWS